MQILFTLDIKNYDPKWEYIISPRFRHKKEKIPNLC